jgi:predicted lipoprotein with Yx(FWY)xxD motif
MKRILLAAGAFAFATTMAFAAPTTKTVMVTLSGAAANVLADDKGMVLYTYDKDTKGAAKANCTGGCVMTWPAYTAAAGAAAGGDWTIVDGLDKDGKAIKQWAYKGMPVYYFARDTMPNQATGDNQGMVWHIIKM